MIAATKPCCGELADADVEAESLPGHWIVCLRCGEPLIYRSGMTLATPEPQDYDGIKPSLRTTIRGLARAIKAQRER